MTTYDPSKNRPASNPGGMECMTCGDFFIGEEWHKECAVCHKRWQDALANKRELDRLERARGNTNPIFAYTDGKPPPESNCPPPMIYKPENDD